MILSYKLDNISEMEKFHSEHSNVIQYYKVKFRSSFNDRDQILEFNNPVAVRAWLIENTTYLQIFTISSIDAVIEVDLSKSSANKLYKFYLSYTDMGWPYYDNKEYEKIFASFDEAKAWCDKNTNRRDYWSIIRFEEIVTDDEIKKCIDKVNEEYAKYKPEMYICDSRTGNIFGLYQIEEVTEDVKEQLKNRWVTSGHPIQYMQDSLKNHSSNQLKNIDFKQSNHEQIMIGRIDLDAITPAIVFKTSIVGREQTYTVLDYEIYTSKFASDNVFENMLKK